MTSTSRSDRALVAFVPSPHRGYLELFRKYEGSSLFVLGDEFIREFPSLVRFLPAARPQDVSTMVWHLGIFKSVNVLGSDGLERIRRMDVVMPDEDVSHAFAEKHLGGVPVAFDGSWRLRWDWGQTVKERRPEGEALVTSDELHRNLLYACQIEAAKSPDWWRQIGALFARDGKILTKDGIPLIAHNEHMPHEQSLYLLGDPRSSLEPPGSRLDIAANNHAERKITAMAARLGICTEGADLYVSCFPCPPCAHEQSETGIKRLFYGEGYSLITGADALRSKGIEIIRVDMTQPSS